MESKEVKAITKANLSIILIAILFLVSSALELWGFYLTSFRVFTFPALTLAGLLAALGLLRLKLWGLVLSYTLYLPWMVQASTLLWSLILLEGFHPSSYRGVLEISLSAYLILLTLSLILLWKKRKSFQ